MKVSEAKLEFERAAALARPGAERLNIRIETTLKGVQRQGDKLTFWTPTLTVTVDGPVVAVARRA